MMCADCCCVAEHQESKTEQHCTDDVVDPREPLLLLQDGTCEWHFESHPEIVSEWRFDRGWSDSTASVTAKDSRLPENGQNVFMAVLMKERDGEPLGVNVDSMDEKVLHICKVSTGCNTPVARYNATAGTKQIKPGDYFLIVNGMSEESVAEGVKVSDSLRRQLLVPRTVEVMVSRPNQFEVKVDFKGQDLDLDVTYSNYGISLLIVKITPGVVGTSASEVRPGDRIVTVNDFEGSPPALLKALKRHPETVKLKVSRPFPNSPCRPHIGIGKSAVSFANDSTEWLG